MAEVPEVETLASDLREAVVGRTFLSVDVLLPEAVRFPSVAEFSAMLVGRTVLGAARRAKFILMPLSGGLTLALHMMLWGTLSLVSVGSPRRHQTLIVFGLDQGQELLFTDTLGYARAALAPDAELVQRLDLDSLGPEALDPAFSPQTLARQFSGRRGVLKTVLLNQRVLAGLGNRDADESLWLAGIDPRRSVLSLSEDEIVRLHAGIRQVLTEGLALRGTQRDLFGRMGRARHRRYIFERTGQPCPRCGASIVRERIGGRNTHFCPGCQH